MDKTQRIKDFVTLVLQEDIVDLRGLPLRETAPNVALSILMVPVTTIHLALSIWQLVASLMLVGYDLVSKGLVRIMPAPKETSKG